MRVDKSTRVLWLRPDKPSNISVGRSRIAEYLRKDGYAVSVEETNLWTVMSCLRKAGHYDVIVGTTRAGALAGMVLSRAHRVPLIVDHVDPIEQFRETSNWPVAAIVDRLEQLSFRVAQRVLYVYPEERERVRSCARAATKTDLGVDFERFTSPDPDQIEAVQDRLDIDSRIVVYVGGLEPIYNIQTMLEAVDFLEGWTLVIAGDGSLREHVAQAGDEHESVVYLGTIPHETIPELLAHADVGLSLVDDPHTLKVLEYGAAGLPTVQLAGSAEKSLGDAVTYCELNPVDIASAIETANGTDTSSLQTLAKQHGWRRIADQYRNAIDEVVEN